MLIFLGTSISWVGTTEPRSTLSNGVVNSSATATYTIDDQEPIKFNVPLSPNSNPYFNQILFDVGQLSFGQHKLVVEYFGNSTSAPLALNYFVQQNAPSSTTNSSPTIIITSAPEPLSSSSNSSPRKPTAAIIGGIIGGLVLISLLLALFFFYRRRNNRRSQALDEKSITADVINPFTLPPSNSASTFLPQNYTSNGQSLPSQSMSSKFAQKGQPSDPASTSSSGGISPLTALQSDFSPPALIPQPEALSSSCLPLSTSPQSNLDGTRTRVPPAETEPLMQRSPSPRGDNAVFLMHEDSGVRMPPSEDDRDVVELPPSYTPG
jgi:hypothetical protein